MRQGQSQGRQRSRGRNNNRNNNNRNSNNLNRSMESNGPDVRIRGTASHIADKYQQLARDSHSSGDIVAAESYWQHAEHYSRLIAVAQAAQNQAREEQQAKQSNDEDNSNNTRSDNSDGSEPSDNGSGRGRGRGRSRNNSDREASADKGADNNQNDEKSESVNGSGPQPTISDTPAEVALSEKPVNGSGAEDGNGEEAPKPRKTRRSKKSTSDDSAPITAAENKAELPSFISGGADD